MTVFDEKYWTSRYNTGQTQWDAGEITTPLKEYFNSLKNKDIEILIPGGGNGYEAAFLHKNGFKNVFLLDISAVPLKNFRNKHPDFPAGHLLHEDFFKLKGAFDLVVEQTFFCALHPENRREYAKKTAELLKPGGHLAGVLFDGQFNQAGPPFGGNKEEYQTYFEPYFTIRKLERCYNSIEPREGRELWINIVAQSV